MHFRRHPRARSTRHTGGHFVDHGSVGCPVKGCDVDIERCVECDAFDGVANEDGVTVLYCRPRVRHEPEVWMSSY